MPRVVRRESICGPLAVDGRTITLVAQSRAVRVAPGQRGLRVRARPSHVEVLEEDGRRAVVPVPDVSGALMRAIVGATLGCLAAIGVRNLRRDKGT
ncbi:MAG TPA: hypothetical protein VFR41_05705 [Acidimicrobiia bacterium]|nr:hypothetical protein [Acidimicrobiia bacterium]